MKMSEWRSRPDPGRPRIPLQFGTLGITIAVYGILGYVLSSKPPAALPAPVAGALAIFPSIIAAVNAAALTCLLAGWRAIRARKVRAHRRFMLAAVTLISVFLVLYVTRVSLGGVKAFPGPPEIRRYVYMPALTIHIILSILSVPPVVFNVLTGLMHRADEISKTGHSRVGRVGVTLWSVSLALGILVYLMLNVLY